VPSAPRYFIPALKKPVKRASQKVLYFATEEDRNYAYMVINSSLLYWWWRVRDGGMTLSLETLTSLPLPEFKINKKIVLDLENSEKTSKVYKQNAGAAQENVKHPKLLIDKLNQAVIPEYARLLGRLHENSELTRLIKKE
jgi:phage-related protein